MNRKSCPGSAPGRLLCEGASQARNVRNPVRRGNAELLELAIDKGVRKFVTRAQENGLFPTLPGTSAHPSDEVLFEKQIEEME